MTDPKQPSELATEHPLYDTWCAMISRCHNPHKSNFKYYGAKGVSVCAEWRKSFWTFVADMGPKPGHAYSLDRIDGNGNYNPSNTRWATRKEQNGNRSNVLRVTINGVTRCVQHWCEQFGVNPKVAYNRIARGWGSETAVTKPISLKRSRAARLAILKSKGVE